MVLKQKFNNYGQIWIETMIYLLIGLTIMGIVLAFVLPKIDRVKDRTVLDQSLSMLESIDGYIMEVNDFGQGNLRNPKISIKKGKLIIDYNSDTIKYILEDSREKYSEPYQMIDVGDTKVLTTPVSEDRYDITLLMNYSGKLDLNSTDTNNVKVLQESPTGYKLKIQNEGWNPDLNKDGDPDDGGYSIAIKVD